MKEIPITCPCQNLEYVEEEQLRSKLVEIWSHCPALKEILLPYSELRLLLSHFDQFAHDAHHRSVVIMALKEGYLKSLTSPIHRFIFEEGKINRKVQNNYLKDLKETWLRETSTKERFEKFKIYMGKLSELTFAQHLEGEGYQIINLEAWGGSVDIQASKNGKVYIFEVKYIGQNKEEFFREVNSYETGGVYFDRPDTSATILYILLRIYQASKQIQRNKRAGQPIIAILFGYKTWSYMKLPIKDNWVIWWNLSQYFLNRDPEWQILVKAAKEDYEEKYGVSDMEEDISRSINEVSKIRFLETVHFEINETLESKNPNYLQEI